MRFRKLAQGTVNSTAKVTRNKQPVHQSEGVRKLDLRTSPPAEALGEVRVEQGWTQSVDYESVSIRVAVTLPVVLDNTGAYRMDEPFDSEPVTKAIVEAERIGRKEMNRIADKLRKLLRK